jgi:octaprenyl-diphosphate synthase
VGHDLQEGKLTLPVLLACEAQPALRERIRAELGDKGMSAGAAATLLEAVREAGGVERARTQARTLVDEALAELSALPPSPHRDALSALALFSVHRVS